MSMSTSDTGSRRLITAFFDTAGAAQQAVRDLTAAGVPRDRIVLREGDGTAASPRDDRSFWDELKDLFLPEEDRYTYAEGLRRGGYLLSVQADAADYERLIDILDTDGAVDMSGRESEWRSQGWQDYAGRSSETSAAGAGAAASAIGMTTAGTRTTPATQVRSTPATASGASRDTMASGRVDTGREEVIPLAEERIAVGKRDVSHGKVRLRSYVVETPVRETVSLREQHVEVERIPVDRPVTAADNLFRDRVIEAEERVEEAVISKTAHIREEVRLRTTGDTRTEQVNDTVRRTEVEVDDGRGTATRTGMAGSAGFTGGMSAVAGRIGEHMDVIASDGRKIGTVDHMEGTDRIKLAKSTSPDGQHHIIPLDWVDHVDQHVHLNRPSQQVQQSW